MFENHSPGPAIGEREIVMERLFNAPRALMFQVFTQPEHLKRWWAPPPYTLPTCTIDLRPGGIWHYCMRSPGGQDHWARSVYREIVPPEKLVYTTTFADEQANPLEGMPEHLTTVLFREEEGKTRVIAHVPHPHSGVTGSHPSLVPCDEIRLTREPPPPFPWNRGYAGPLKSCLSLLKKPHPSLFCRGFSGGRAQHPPARKTSFTPLGGGVEARTDFKTALWDMESLYRRVVRHAIMGACR